jgi:DNA-binding NtrC family response regulator
MTTIVLVDDEPNVLRSLERMCMNAMGEPALPDDIKVVTFTDPGEALVYLRGRHADLVISDFRMPVMDGATFLTHVKALRPDTARVILSACTDMPGIVRAINDAGIFRFVAKPWSDTDLRATIISVLDHRAMLLENKRLADELRAQKNVISRQQLELSRLEAETPGITRVRWTEDGGVLLED